MKINEIILREVKARIDHPEDLVLDNGAAGANAALATLQSLSDKTGHISIKFDGSPSLIAGYDEDGFTLVDKAAFSSKKIDLPRTPLQLQKLIFNRAPDQEGRREYSIDLSKLFIQVKNIMPIKKGFVQFDVLWFTRPPIKNNNFVFQPNKVIYTIPVDSEIGQQIAKSYFGIVIHSYFANRLVQESTPIKDVNKLNFKHNPLIVVLNTDMVVDIPIGDPTVLRRLNNELANSSSQIDTFLNKGNLQKLKISDLSALIKSFLANTASQGTMLPANANKLFLNWVKSSPRINYQKKERIISYINSNKEGYNKIFDIILKIINYKYKLLKQLSSIKTSVNAELHGATGHEGYVIDSPSAKIKLVDRPVFMRKD